MAGRRRRGHGGHGGGSHERWLLTYADLITLLLAFFIILYAMSKSDYHKVSDLSRSLRSAFQVTSGGAKDPLSGDPNVLTGASGVMPDGTMVELQEQIKQKIAKENGAKGEKDVQVSVDFNRGIVISLASSAFFDSGQANLRPDTIGILKTVAGVLKSVGRQIMVEGHTDNTPIHTTQYPSNWELSTARATTVLRWLVEAYKLPPERLSAAGYGEYHPLVDNTIPENRAKNRRVDIVILKDAMHGQRTGGQLW